MVSMMELEQESVDDNRRRRASSSSLLQSCWQILRYRYSIFMLLCDWLLFLSCRSLETYSTLPFLGYVLALASYRLMCHCCNPGTGKVVDILGDTGIVFFMLCCDWLLFVCYRYLITYSTLCFFGYHAKVMYT